MLTPRQAQLAFTPLVVVAMSGIISFAMTALQQGWSQALIGAWLRNWPVAFAVALPAAWVVLPGVRALLERATRATTAPSTSRGVGEQG